MIAVTARRIHQLPPALVNRIAAGEVIERPASVVKELVENALDAGAANILVEAQDGGRELIRVVDDGGGIAPDDLPLAFASHATSKIESDDDLFRISSMGFRGEALASIGSIAQVRLQSRIASNDAAYEVYDRGGTISDVQAAAGNVGTTIEVRNLFYNTPARRKFLKGSSTEFGHITETLLRLALPFPDVSFKLLHNGRTTLDLPPADPVQRLLAAWPGDFHEQRLPLDVSDAEIRLYGIIGLPELARPTARYQFLYLNRRSIRDRFIQHALREAYRGLIEPGRHPAAILLLDIPPQDVDVNVHPTKSEVRFRDSGRIHGLVLASIREKLLGSDLAPTAQPNRMPQNDPQRQDMRTRLAEFFKQQLPAPGASSEQQSLDVERWKLNVGRSESPGSPDSTLNTQRPTSNVQQDDHAPHPQLATPNSQLATSSPPALQLHNSYLIAQSDDGLLIIDQHALHERIMYEELYARLARGPLESQRLLIPHTIPATGRQIAILDHIQPLLTRLGIEITPFGPDTLAVQAFPTFLERLDPGQFVQELLERGEQELLDLHQEELLHEILDMMACKAAVKAGDPLSGPEIDALLARREQVERSSNCPHGRPTTLRLSLRDLEKQFKRTGF
jgi:DNA mismatch repair protein MutL